MWLQVQFCYAVGAIDRKAAAFMVRFHLLGSDNTQKFMQIKSVIWSKKKRHDMEYDAPLWYPRSDAGMHLVAAV